MLNKKIWARYERCEGRWKTRIDSRDSWSADSPILARRRCVKHQGGRQSQLFCSLGASKQRRFWATHANRKWTYSHLIRLFASKFILLRVFSLIETICPKICSKSSLKRAKSPLPVDARPSEWSLLFRHHQSKIVVPKKMGNTVQCTIHGEPLEAVDHHKFLGVELSSDLNC